MTTANAQEPEAIREKNEPSTRFGKRGYLGLGLERFCRRLIDREAIIDGCFDGLFGYRREGTRISG